MATAPIERDKSNDVHHRNATVIYCENLQGYPLPGHTKRWPNKVKEKSEAKEYAKAIDGIMTS